MSLRVAVQMDPMASIKIAGDSSFALMEAAQARGHPLFHYDVGSLAWESDGSPRGKITAHAAPVTVQPVKGDHFTIGEPVRLDLAQRCRCRADAAGPAIPSSAISLRPHYARPAREGDAGGQQSRLRPQRAGESLCARLCPVHAANPDHPRPRRSARLPEGTWRDRRQTAARQWRQGDFPGAGRRQQSQRCSRCSTRPGRNRIWSSPSFPKCIRATSGSCWSTASSPARSTASPAKASSAAISPRAAMPRPPD